MTDDVTDDIFWIHGTRMSWFDSRLGHPKKEKVYISYMCYLSYILYIYCTSYMYIIYHILPIYVRSKVCVI